MFRPSLRTNFSLIALSILSILILFIISLSNGNLFDQQKAAGERMQRSVNKVTAEFNKLLKADKAVWDKKIDPDKEGIIGPETSPIVTSRGVLSEKRRALNPNLPAVFIKWFDEANLQAGDYVAVGVSGASPAINIALYSAIKEYGLNPVVITALSSSRFGASNINLTWLDMEEAIYPETGIKSYCASRGGNRDVAAGLNSEGKELLVDIISNKGLQLVEGNSSRIKMYEQALPKGKEYKAFINIGGAVANVGSVVSANLLKEGVNNKLPELERSGVLNYFSEKEVPVIHMFKGNDTFEKYYFANDGEDMDELGKGIIYGYSLTFAIIGLIILLIAIAVVVRFDRSDRHFMANLVGHNED